MKPILVITDNQEVRDRFIELIGKFKEYEFYIIPSIHFKTCYFKGSYEMIISLHCKMIFPPMIINEIRCINVHPGLNPYNRGWFPQVFSIINGLPCGATIHEMDEKIDNGAVICQKEVIVESWDTSLNVYEKIIDTEMELLNNNLKNIIESNYKAVKKEKGNLNLKKDFEKLCEIDLDNKDTFQNHINKLRALTHGDYANAYYTENGKKIYLKIELR